jgi:hypothetical protein
MATVAATMSPMVFAQLRLLAIVTSCSSMKLLQD